MQKLSGRGWTFLLLPLLFVLFSCMQKKAPLASPQGYNLSSPQKFVLPSILTEISGLAFANGNPDMIYAQEDENGTVYSFPFGYKRTFGQKRFGPHGDYEDITILRNQIVVLRSDGTLITFELAELQKKNMTTLKTFENLLPKGEYEGMYGDEKSGLLYVLCKSCKADKKSDKTSGYMFKLSGGSITPAGNFGVTVNSGKKKSRFMPSALAKNPRTDEWYILSSVNKVLVVADAGWNVKNTYPLSSPIFPQPEGIAFDNQYNLYISNEGGKGAATILKFVYKK